MTQTSPSGYFSYTEGHPEIFTLRSGDRVLISPLDPNVARICFVDGNGNERSVPNGYTLRDSDKFVTPPLGNNFVITWAASYTLSHFENLVLKVNQDRRQSIHVS
jgi:hypothetical protein